MASTQAPATAIDERRLNPAAAAAWVSLFVIFGLGLRCFMQSPLNWDVAWYLWAGERLRDGATLYTDVADMNPPLIYWLNTAFAHLATASGISTKATLAVTLLTFLVAVLCVSAIIVRTAWSGARWLSILAVLTAALFWGMNRPDLGQRDQIAGYAMLPIVLLAGARGLRPPTVVSFAASVIAGVGIALKPFFLLPWLLVLATSGVPLRQAAGRPEFWLVVAINIGYWVAAAVIHPEFGSQLKSVVAHYSALNASVLGIAKHLAPYIAVVVALQVVPVSPSLRPLVRAGTAASVGFSLAALAQHKGWSYHYIPAEYFTAVTAIVVLFGWIATRPDPHPLQSTRANAGLCAALVFFALWRMTVPISRDALDRDMRSVKELIRPHSTVLLLTTEFRLGLPLLYDRDLALAFPQPFLWQLPGIYRDQVQASRTKAVLTPAQFHPTPEGDEKALLTGLRSALAKRPDAILVDTAPTKIYLGRLQFDYLAYLRAGDSQTIQQLAEYAVAFQTPRVTVLSRVAAR